MRVDHDHHVHSTFSDDAHSTPEDNLAAALRRGLASIRMTDHVRGDTTYVPEFLAAVAALRPPEGLEVLTGVEAKLLDTSGAVDAPPEVLRSLGTRSGPGRVLLADHQLPGPDGPWSPRVARERLASGLEPVAAVQQLIDAYAGALRHTGPAQLAHPFSILPKIGLSEEHITEDQLDELAAAVLAADAVVEVNEKWRCPGARIRARLDRHGVAMVASSDAHHADDVGRYQWLALEAEGGTRSTS